MMRAVMLTMVVMLAACGSGLDESAEADVPEVTPQSAVSDTTGPADEPPADSSEREDIVEPPTPRTPSTRADLSAEVQIAGADLAGRLGMGEADIEVFSVETVTWRDGSLGCPVEGRAYTQALIPDGYRIILTANGEKHYYHGAGQGQPFLCEDPQEPYRGGGTG